MGSKPGVARYEYRKSVAVVVNPVETEELEKSVAEEIKVEDPKNGPEVIELHRQDSDEPVEQTEV